MSDVPKRLKFLRERDRVTITRLASAIGIDKETLRDIEAGRQEPTEQAIWLIASFFDVKPEYLTGGPQPGGRKPDPDRAPPAAPEKGRAAERPEKAAATGKRSDLDFSEFGYFEDRAEKALREPASEPRPAPATAGEIVTALVDLLVEKGLVTKKEIEAAIRRARGAR
jgi:transcriptional regulator with XRE-family HTH domain